MTCLDFFFKLCKPPYRKPTEQQPFDHYSSILYTHIFLKTNGNTECQQVSTNMPTSIFIVLFEKCQPANGYLKSQMYVWKVLRNASRRSEKISGNPFYTSGNQEHVRQIFSIKSLVDFRQMSVGRYWSGKNSFKSGPTRRRTKIQSLGL